MSVGSFHRFTRFILRLAVRPRQNVNVRKEPLDPANVCLKCDIQKSSHVWLLADRGEKSASLKVGSEINVCL